VQESGKHGGEAAGPVVRDIIKAYYDKKNKKMPSQLTAENKPKDPSKNETAAKPAPARVALKPEETAAVASGHAANASPNH